MDCCFICLPVWHLAQQNLALSWDFGTKIGAELKSVYGIKSARRAVGSLPCSEAVALVAFAAALASAACKMMWSTSYTSCLGVQKVAVYHNAVSSLSIQGLWCVLRVIFCTGFFFKDCHLRETRITLTSITWLGFMFVFWEKIKKKIEHGKITQ